LPGRALFWVSLGLILAGCATEHSDSLAEYHETYNKPLVSSGALFATLPPAVQNTLRAETGSAEISDVSKEASLGRIVYRISFQNSSMFPPLYVAADGTLLAPDLQVAIGAPQDRYSIVTGGPVTGISLNDLPPPVMKTIQSHASDAQVDTILKQVHGDQTTYWVTFKDRMHLPLQLASDGTILNAPSN
jgi:hypothetical protein